MNPLDDEPRKKGLMQLFKEGLMTQMQELLDQSHKYGPVERAAIYRDLAASFASLQTATIQMQMAVNDSRRDRR